MQRFTRKRRHAAGIGLLLLLGTLLLFATCGGTARPGSRTTRTPPAPTAATPTLPATAAPSPSLAASAPSTGVAIPAPAHAGITSSNSLLAWVILAALGFVALFGLLSTRRRRRPPPDTG